MSPRTFEATTPEDIAAAVHAAAAALEPLIGTVEDVALPHTEEIVPAVQYLQAQRVVDRPHGADPV